MDQNQQYIAQSVKDGSYFAEAKEFYAIKYLYPFTLRAQILLISMLVVVGAYVSFQTFINDYISVPVPFAMYARDQVNYYPMIKPLALETEPVELSISRYLAQRYVILRESYDYKDFTADNKAHSFEEIRALSSKKVYREYTDYMDTEINSSSPLLLYKNKFKKKVAITHSQLNKVEGQLVGATIDYTVHTKSLTSNEIGHYRADIEFYLNSLDKVAAGQEKLDFIITQYSTYKLSK